MLLQKLAQGEWTPPPARTRFANVRIQKYVSCLISTAPSVALWATSAGAGTSRPVRTLCWPDRRQSGRALRHNALRWFERWQSGPRQCFQVDAAGTRQAPRKPARRPRARHRVFHGDSSALPMLVQRSNLSFEIWSSGGCRLITWERQGLCPCK